MFFEWNGKSRRPFTIDDTWQFDCTVELYRWTGACMLHHVTKKYVETSWRSDAGVIVLTESLYKFTAMCMSSNQVKLYLTGVTVPYTLPCLITFKQGTL